MTRNASRGSALVIVPAFFGYEKDIVAEFKRQGYETTFFDERPSDSALARAVLRFRKGFIARLIQKYYLEKWSELQNSQFDIVFVVKAEAIPRWFLENLRRVNPGARFVFYAWDALRNEKNCLGVLDCFDELFSFDSEDATTHENFTYLPLFYTKEFEALDAEQTSRPRRYQLSFVGTLHTDRYGFVKRLFAGRSGTFSFFHVQARWYFVVAKYLTREHSAATWSDVSFHKLSRVRVAEIFRDSVAVIDIPRRGQTGLTIRTFEVLASGSVLVTTNPAISREPFFDPRRIVVLPTDLDEQRTKVALAQLDAITPPAGPPDSFDRYSLKSWVQAIVGGAKESGATRNSSPIS